MADGLAGLPGIVRNRRVQFSLRLDDATKRAFSDASERAGLDPSAAARCLIEICVQRLSVEKPDLLAVLHAFRATPLSDEGKKE